MPFVRFVRALAAAAVLVPSVGCSGSDFIVAATDSSPGDANVTGDAEAADAVIEDAAADGPPVDGARPGDAWAGVCSSATATRADLSKTDSDKFPMPENGTIGIAFPTGARRTIVAIEIALARSPALSGADGAVSARLSSGTPATTLKPIVTKLISASSIPEAASGGARVLIQFDAPVSVTGTSLTLEITDASVAWDFQIGAGPADKSGVALYSRPRGEAYSEIETHDPALAVLGCP